MLRTQSGHVAAVGFELYVSMLDDAVAALSGTAADEAPEPVRVDVPVDAYVPGDYVPYEAAKIEIHRRVAGAREVAQLIVLREELEDRFGPIPEALENLIKLQNARIKLGRFDLARAYIAAGDYTEADTELSSCMKRRGEATDVYWDVVPTFHFFPPTYYYVGRNLEGLKSGGASDAYKTFLGFKVAEAEDPMVADASRRVH